MQKIILAAICLAFAVPAAQAQSIAEKTGVNSALGIAPKTGDFVKEVAISDMFEIQSSQLAAQKATKPGTKSFATQMIADHTKTSAELKGLAGNHPVPSALDDTHQKKLDKLKGLSGEDFTKQYDSIQESAHKSAVSLFERYAKGGDDPKLKDWAGKTLPTLKHHLAMADAINK